MKHPVPLALVLTLLDLVLFVTGITPLAVAVMVWRRKRWAWLETPDEPFPGDLTIPEVKAWADRYGQRVAYWYWLGVRNRLHGLDFVFAVRLPLAWDQSAMGLQTQGDLWWNRRPVLGGKYQVKTGWRLTVVGGLPYGVPCATITRN